MSSYATRRAMLTLRGSSPIIPILLVAALQGCDLNDSSTRRPNTKNTGVSMAAPRGYTLTKNDKKFYEELLPFLPSVNGDAMGISEVDTEVFLPVSYYAQEEWSSSQDAPKPQDKSCRELWTERESGGWHSHYFTWLSKSLAQPIMSGYKSSATMHKTADGQLWRDHTGARPCGSSFADCWFTGMTNKHFGGQKKACCEDTSCPQWLTDQGIENSGVTTALYDKGHMVPDLAMAEQFGADSQTYSMCNIGPQTSSLNAHKWQSVEKMVNCVGKQKELIVLGGPLPAFQADPAGCLKGGGEFNDNLIRKNSGSSGGLDAWPTTRDFVPKGYWKVIYDVSRKLTFVYLYNNDFIHASCEFQFSGEQGMKVIEAATGFTFPMAWKNTFGGSHEDFVSGTTDCKPSNFKTDECEGRSAPEFP